MNRKGFRTRARSVLLLAALLAGPAQAEPACLPPPSGIVDWLRAENDAEDRAAGVTGTLDNGARFGEGKVGRAFDLDGLDDAVRVPHREAQNPGSQLSIEAWVYQRSPQHGRVILQKRAGTPPDGIGGYSFESTHAPYGPDYGLQFIVWIAGLPQVVQTPPNLMRLNRWQHVAATYDGSALRIYVDGQPRASLPASGTIDARGEPLLLGRNAVYENLVWDGLIDEASVYNRALGAAEVAALAGAGSAGKCAPSAVGGAVNGMSLGSGKLVCTNVTTGKSASLRLPDSGTAWDCARSGLEIRPGDVVNQSLSVNGKAR